MGRGIRLISQLYSVYVIFLFLLRYQQKKKNSEMCFSHITFSVGGPTALTGLSASVQLKARIQTSLRLNSFRYKQPFIFILLSVRYY